MPAEGLLKAGFEPFAKSYVKRVEDDGRPPAAVTRLSPSPQAGVAGAAAPSGAAGGGGGRGGMAAPLSEVRVHVCVFFVFCIERVNRC